MDRDISKGEASIMTYRSLYVAESNIYDTGMQGDELSFSPDESDYSGISSRSTMIQRLVNERMKLGFVKLVDSLPQGLEWEDQGQEEEASGSLSVDSDLRDCYKMFQAEYTRQHPEQKAKDADDSRRGYLQFPEGRSMAADLLRSEQDLNKDLLMFLHRRRSTHTPLGFQPASPEFKKIEKQSQQAWTPLTKSSDRYVRFLFEEALSAVPNIKVTSKQETGVYIDVTQISEEGRREELAAFSMDSLMENIPLDKVDSDVSLTSLWEKKEAPWWALPEPQNSTESIKAIRHIYSKVNEMKKKLEEDKANLKDKETKLYEEDYDVIEQDQIEEDAVSSIESYVLRDEAPWYTTTSPEGHPEPIQRPERDEGFFDMLKYHKSSRASLSRDEVGLLSTQPSGSDTDKELKEEVEGVKTVEQAEEEEALREVRETLKPKTSFHVDWESEESDRSIVSRPSLSLILAVKPPVEEEEEEICDLSFSTDESLFDVQHVESDISLFRDTKKKKSFFLNQWDKRKKAAKEIRRDEIATRMKAEVQLLPVSMSRENLKDVDHFKFITSRPEWIPFSRNCNEIEITKDNLVQVYRCLSKNEGIPVFEAIAKSLTSKTANFTRLGHTPPGTLKIASKILENNRRLRKIKLTGQSLTTDDLHHLTSSMVNMPKLQRLHLNFTGLTADNVVLLKEVLLYLRELCYLDLSSNNLEDKGVNQLCKAIEELQFLTNLNLSSNGLTVDCLTGLKSVLGRANKLKALDLSWNEINNSAGFMSFAQFVTKKSTVVLEELRLAWNGLEGRETAVALHMLASLETLFLLDISFNEFGFREEMVVFRRLLLDSPALEYFLMQDNPLDQGMDSALLGRLHWESKPALKLVDLGDYWFTKDMLQVCMRYKEQYGFTVKISHIKDNIEIFKPDMRALYLKRIVYLNSVVKKKRPRKHLGLVLMRMEKRRELQPMRHADFNRLLTNEKLKVDNGLGLALAKVFSREDNLVNLEEMLAMIREMWPDLSLVEEKRRPRAESLARVAESSARVAESRQALDRLEPKELLPSRPPEDPSHINYSFLDTN